MKTAGPKEGLASCTSPIRLTIRLLLWYGVFSGSTEAWLSTHPPCHFLNSALLGTTSAQDIPLHKRAEAFAVPLAAWLISGPGHPLIAVTLARQVDPTGSSRKGRGDSAVSQKGGVSCTALMAQW